jgi:hypothetical protein
MAITFLEQRKRQQYMIPLLVLVLCITLFVVWSGSRSQTPVVVDPIDSMEYIPSSENNLPGILQTVNVNFDFLESFNPSKFKTFEVMSNFEGEPGRDNPFIPFNQ